MIIFIPFQRFLYFLLFNNPPKDDLLRGEIISIKTKSFHSPAKANFYDLSLSTVPPVF